MIFSIRKQYLNYLSQARKKQFEIPKYLELLVDKAIDLFNLSGISCVDMLQYMLEHDINNWVHYYAYTFIIPIAQGKSIECVKDLSDLYALVMTGYILDDFGFNRLNIEEIVKGEQLTHIMAYAEKAGVEISALAYYPNVMTADKEKRKAAIEHLKNVIRASKKLGVGMVTTFIGRDQTKNVRENLELVKEIWPPIIKLAEVCDVKIAIENCPMLFGEEQWPGGQNLMTTPPIWREVFKILDSDNLGINYDPSHFIWQMIDYIRPLYEFKDKIFHVHYKDIKIYKDKLESCGIMAYPLEYMSPKIPGLGDVDWGKYVSALTDIGYDGCTCIEIEDKAFEDSKEKVEKSLILSKRYLEKYVI